MDEMFHIQVNRGSHTFVKGEKHFFFKSYVNHRG